MQQKSWFLPGLQVIKSVPVDIMLEFSEVQGSLPNTLNPQAKDSNIVGCILGTHASLNQGRAWGFRAWGLRV